jgi:hypothetical protein
MHLVGLLDRLRGPARGFEVPQELRVLHHALEVLLALPQVHDHHLVVPAGADLGHSTRLLAGYCILQLPVDSVLFVNLPPEGVDPGVEVLGVLGEGPVGLFW